MPTSRLLPPEANNSSSWSKRLSQRWNSLTHWFNSIERRRPFRSFTVGAKATRLGSYLFSSTASVASATLTVTPGAEKAQPTASDDRHEEKPDKTSIENLNADVISVLTSFLRETDHASIHEAVRFNRRSHRMFEEGCLKKLMQGIVNGDYDGVKKILTTSSRLSLERLEEKDNITSLSGQKSNNVTPYRTALAVEDTEIAILIKNKMIEQKAGHIADQQYHEQFPKDWEKEEKERWASVFEKLETLTQAIRHANREEKDIISSGAPHYRSGVRKNSAVAIALAQFRLQLDVRLNETVTTGRHCNPNLLLEAYRIYEEHYADYFGNWSDPRALLFWQQVIGTIQRGLPVNVVQAFCDGLYSTERKLRNNSPQGRSLTIRLYIPDLNEWLPTAFYPLADSRLGFEWAAGCSWARGWAAVGHGDGIVALHGLSKLMSIKNSGHAETYAPAKR